MHDDGLGNEVVGHRRTLLRPDNKVLGTGDAWPSAAQMSDWQSYKWPGNAIVSGCFKQRAATASCGGPARSVRCSTCSSQAEFLRCQPSVAAAMALAATN